MLSCSKQGRIYFLTLAMSDSGKIILVLVLLWSMQASISYPGIALCDAGKC